jgi:hypothetical protein
VKRAALLAVVAIAATASGCGFGAGGESRGTVTMRVTEDFGESLILEARLENPAESDTVIGFLDRAAEIETSYGGNFVDSIEGREGTTSGGGDHDWFYFVNGMYAEIGGGERKVRPGERIWWDYRYWYEAERIPIVVGSWPEPFKSGYEGKRPELMLGCVRAVRACDAVRARLDEQGVEYVDAKPRASLEDPKRMRILVGAWAALKGDPAVAQLEGEPRESGVYASFLDCDGRPHLIVRGADGEPRAVYEEAGLVAAVRKGTEEPTLVLTGTDDTQVASAAALLQPQTLEDRYAVAAVAGEAVSVPVPGDEAPDPSARRPCG